MSRAELRLIASAPTPGLRRALFGADDDLDAGGLAAATRLAAAAGPAGWGRPDAVLAAPARAAQQTARAAGFHPRVAAVLADGDYGRWTGCTLSEVAAAEPAAVERWLTDPGAAPHGGEPLTAVVARMAGWLAGVATDARRVLAFTSAAVVRAALVAALDLPATGVWQLDVAPLAVIRLRRRAHRWCLHLPAAG